MAMIRPETEMKDSGVQWIGDIPSDWETTPLKKIVVDRAGGAWGNEPYENNSTICMRIADFDFDRGVFQDKSETELTKRSYKEYQIDKLLLQTNDICIEKSGGGEKTPVGRAVLFDKPYDALFANFMDRIRVDNAVSFPKYVEYYLRAMYFLSVTTLYIKQTTGIQNLNVTSLLEKEVITLPPLSEQQVIADYLDETCSKIDEIIAEAKASIDEYKELKQSVIDNATMTGIHDSEMKNTDYVWFPEMPKSWDLVLASLLFREDVRPVDANDVSLSLSQVDGLIPTDDMSERSLKSATHDNWKHVIPDDLVLNRFKGHLGVFFASKYTGMVSFHYGVYHAIRDDVYAKYYEYLFHSMTYKNIFALKSNGITVGLQNLSNGNFYSVKILHPTLDDQIEIVKYLDKRIAEIDSLIAEKESLIKDLESYKKSLIYEVVTGKRRVV